MKHNRHKFPEPNIILAAGLSTTQRATSTMNSVVCGVVYVQLRYNLKNCLKCKAKSGTGWSAEVRAVLSCFMSAKYSVYYQTKKNRKLSDFKAWNQQTFDYIYLKIADMIYHQIGADSLSINQIKHLFVQYLLYRRGSLGGWI